MTANQNARLLTLHAITFLHPGTGQTTGVVDLPIQREVHTGFPMFAASGLKGSLRDSAEREWPKVDDDTPNPKVTAIFGSKDAEIAGALGMTDARILAFPVRSLQKVFVWVTCPMVIARLKRDMGLAGIASDKVPDAMALNVADEQAWATTGTAFQSPLVLEEVAFNATENQKVNTLATVIVDIDAAGVGFDQKRLVVVSDTDFAYLVRYATQVSARISLNEKKTTTGGEGNLWYEETLPPETLMYALLLPNKPRNDGGGDIKTAADVMTEIEKLINGKHVQLGGNETVGQGWCIATLTRGPK